VTLVAVNVLDIKITTFLRNFADRGKIAKYFGRSENIFEEHSSIRFCQHKILLIFSLFCNLQYVHIARVKQRKMLSGNEIKVELILKIHSPKKCFLFGSLPVDLLVDQYSPTHGSNRVARALLYT